MPLEQPLTVAVCQMCSGLQKADNLAVAERLIRQAAQRHAKLIALPELFNCGV